MSYTKKRTKIRCKIIIVRGKNHSPIATQKLCSVNKTTTTAWRSSSM